MFLLGEKFGGSFEKGRSVSKDEGFSSSSDGSDRRKGIEERKKAKMGVRKCTE